MTETFRDEWRKHPEYGYMLRRFYSHDSDYVSVVTALCLNMAETESVQKDWEAHKSRLHVNGGCGAIAQDMMRIKDINPDFVIVNVSSVPIWIQADFTANI